jgi:hypothetical protein
MTGSAPFHWLVLLAVAAIQAALVRKARELSRQDDRTSLAELAEPFAADVRARAKRGQSPDWLRYQAETDRLFEFRDDRLRSLAAAALAVGLGGTLFALFVSILSGQGTGFEPATLVQSMGVSLLGSLTGVIVNLLIVLFYLPAAERRFATSVKGFFKELAAEADQHPPQEAFTQTLREELSLIRQSLNTEFASAFSTAITGFPSVVADLGVHIEKLSSVVEKQGQGIGDAVGEIVRCAAVVTDSGSRLQPAAEKLAEASELLVRMPQELAAVVDETRNQWLTGIRKQHEEHVKQLLDLHKQVEDTGRERERQVLMVTRELQAAVAEVRDAVSQIPDHLAAEVAKISGRLGIEFGREARDHTNELAERLGREYEALLGRVEKHEQESRNNIGLIVQELLDRVSSLVEERMVENLQKVAKDLDATVRLLPEAARGLAEAHVELSRTQAESLESWKMVSQRTGDAAQKLVDADGHLHVAVEALAAGADHLEKIAALTGGFEGSLLKSNQETVGQYMTGLDSLREQLIDLLQKVNDGHLRSDRFLESQSEFIRTCIQQLMKGRQVATLETQRSS